MQLGVVQDLHIERGSNRGIVSNVYLGKVMRVLPGMQSAFIDIGLERSAFLHVADIWENSHNGDPAKPIEKVLYEGQTLLVQVIKEPLGTKGARLSTQLSIAGRLLVYLPQETHIGVSQRIESEEQRDALRARLQAILPPEHKGGYIIRTVAEASAELDFAADIAYLDKLWANLQAVAKTASAPQLLYQELDISLRVLRDFVGQATTRILVDSRETYPAHGRLCASLQPGRGRAHRALSRRASAVRSVWRGRGDRAGLVQAGRPEVRRLSDHRPDRSDDHDGREHRRFCRAAQFRRHHIQDQSGGDPGHRTATAPAQSRRHHHLRFHRHGHARSIAMRCWRNSRRPWRATTRASA